MLIKWIHTGESEGKSNQIFETTNVRTKTQPFPGHLLDGVPHVKPATTFMMT